MIRKAAAGIAPLLLLMSMLNPCAATSAAADASATPREPFCNQSLATQIPARAPTAPTGSQIAPRLVGISDDEREAVIRSELLAGNIPGFLRQLQPVTLRGDSSNGENSQITVCVMPDYLALGSDDDFLLIPMRLDTALAVAERFGFSLPTTKLVDAIYAQSEVHLSPQPLPAGAEMRSTGYYVHHNEIVRGQRRGASVVGGALVSGDKKDLVLTNRLWTHLASVAIYGWHRLNGEPIQPLSTVHGWHYADYSHGIRLVSDQILVDHRPQSLYNVLQDPRLASVLSSEGAIRQVTELVNRLKQPIPEAIASVIPDSSGRRPATINTRH
jgi:hypothetical protein